MRNFTKNGLAEYYIIDVDWQNNKMLLQRRSDGEIVVAHNYEFYKEYVTWQQGNYFGKDLVSASKEFYGESGVRS
jgi:hypothetical protein